MFDVVACGFDAVVLDGLAEAGAARTLPDPAEPGFVESAFDALSQRSHEHVLVVHARDPRATRRIRTVRSLLQSSGVVPVPLHRPPTGLATQTAWLAAMAGRGVSAGAALAALPAVDRHLPTYAAATSVARLELPEVRLRHHLLSWLPGTTFRVSLGGVARVEAGRPAPAGASSDHSDPRVGPAADRAADPACDLVWSGDRRLEPHLVATRPARVSQSVELTGTRERDPWWGGARHYEHTVVPRDLDAFVATLGSVVRSTCPQCGEPLAAVCPFCQSLEGAAA